MTKKQPSKRILSVTSKHLVDECPDTSWLGEYSNRPTSEYSIDRAHSEDCASVFPVAAQAKATLEHAQQTVADFQNAMVIPHKSVSTSERTAWQTEWDSLEDAYTQLGELADEVTECDCGGHGDMERGEYRYFNPSFNYVKQDGSPADGLTPADVRKYTREDYRRMESLNRGDWCYLGVTAEAEIAVSNVGRNLPHYVTQRIHSGGLWGIESDSDASYLESEEKNQLADLKDQLRALGFSARAISKAFRDVKHAD